MREIRIYHPAPLADGQETELGDDAANHVVRVLRMNAGAMLTLFCGDNKEYAAQIIDAGKRTVRVKILSTQMSDKESPLPIHLAQAISRGEKMDYTIQKAVELGVASITPLFTERCGVKLADDRLDKRLEHWQSVASSACEQSGRNYVPKVLASDTLSHWLTQALPGTRLTLDPLGQHSLSDLPPPTSPIVLLIGPEGGLSPAEISAASAAGFQGLRLGPRILRTETAALAIIAGLQARFGDF